MNKRLSDSIYQKTEQHRHECEVRYVLQQTKEWIIEHLEGVKLERGHDAYVRLIKGLNKK